MGVNPVQLRTLLHTKLLIDKRRPRAISNRKKEGTSAPISPIWQSILYVFMGGLYALTLTVFKMPLSGHFVYFTMLMVTLVLLLISDFTTVLIDVRDNYIVLPRPVNDQTVSLARILHIVIYILNIVLALGLAGLVYTFVADGPIAGCMFVLEIFCATILSVLFVNLIYLVVLKLTTPRQFKDFIAYFQVIFSVLIFACYYLLPRLIDMSLLAKADLSNYRVIWFLPATWIAALHEILVNPLFKSSFLWPAAVLAVVSPLLSLWLIVKVFAPGFNQKLSGISSSEAHRPEQAPNSTFSARLAAIFTSGKTENAAFRMAWTLSSRLREFKVQTYPSFAYVIVYFVYFFLTVGNKGLSLREKFEHLGESKSYIILIYLTGFVLTNVCLNMVRSEKYKSAWVYFVAPVAFPGQIISGTYKAVVLKFFSSFFLFISIVSMYVWGPLVINDLLFGYFNVLIFNLIANLFTSNQLPFSFPTAAAKSSKRWFVSLIMLFLQFAIGGLHYFLCRWEMVIWGLALLSAFAFFFMIRRYGRQQWSEISVYEGD
ncbi:hypothetical protein B0O44_102392 [Pedobacter nutrimenti]|uniref:ABC-2 type transport system permease protein n=2 Tax=Pedobacter nutrimenti TaxID=1241337 RepID=A0A318UL49_9SPHI|nr:hypothetical protein B0O44_102392 [Pedobacter nutrimenti]